MLSLNSNIFKNIVNRTPCLFYASTAAKKIKTKEKREPLISCQNSKLNFYLNDRNRKQIDQSEIVLASKGWQHYKAKGDYFIIHQKKDASDILKDAPEYKSLGLNPVLVKNLDEKHDITKATKLQQEAIQEILDNQHVLIAAETGCGKVKI